MKKYFLFKIFTIFVLTSFSNPQIKEPIATTKYAGVYSFGHDVKKGPIGSVTVYPETDSTILFYLDICRGAPSYNLGQLYDRLIIKDDTALYFTAEDYNKTGCKLELQFSGEKLTIKTVEGFNECPFGGNVYADNIYYRTETNIPIYFINGEGDTIIFKNMNPEKYFHRYDLKK